MQGRRHGQPGDEAEALFAKPPANGTAAQVLQTARGARQGEERLVEGPVRLQGQRGGISLSTRRPHTSCSGPEEEPRGGTSTFLREASSALTPAPPWSAAGDQESAGDASQCHLRGNFLEAPGNMLLTLP